MNEIKTSAIALSILSALLASCATTDSSSKTGAAGQPRSNGNQQLQLRLASGAYACESGQSIKVQREAELIDISWHGQHHTLRRYDSSSGLPRYEDRKNGLLWIDLPWKSVLMDSNTGRPLANECKAVSS